MLKLLLLLIIGVFLYRIFKSITLVKSDKSKLDISHSPKKNNRQKTFERREAVDAEFQDIED